ncbi:MAG: hypothetical protein KDD35_06640, partial [Bdellovibrionales bacterium]|nr:hypothetical protein [Bdellovibrionales bacterium]
MVTPRSKWINIDVFRPISTILGILLSSPFGLASPSISTGQCRQLVALEESTHLPEAPGPISSVESFIRLTTQSVSDQDPSLRLPKVEIYFSNFPTQRTVAVDNLKALGSGGEGYYLLNRTNDTWRSRSGPNYFAPESDPTWVISALGTRLAGFLGFRLLSESKMVVPNALLFNRRIVALNSLLRKKGFEEIYVRWSPTIEPPSDKITGSYAEEFIRTFYFDKTSPFSDGEIVH